MNVLAPSAQRDNMFGREVRKCDFSISLYLSGKQFTRVNTQHYVAPTSECLRASVHRLMNNAFPDTDSHPLMIHISLHIDGSQSCVQIVQLLETIPDEKSQRPGFEALWDCVNKLWHKVIISVESLRHFILTLALWRGCLLMRTISSKSSVHYKALIPFLPPHWLAWPVTVSVLILLDDFFLCLQVVCIANIERRESFIHWELGPALAVCLEKSLHSFQQVVVHFEQCLHLFMCACVCLQAKCIAVYM